MSIEKYLAYVFALPQAAPIFTAPLPADDRSRVDRYLSLVDDLKESSLFKQPQQFTYSVSNGVETIERDDFLNRELTGGVGVMFRQLYSGNKEPASFDKIHDILFKHLKHEPAEVQEKARAALVQWREAHNKLHGNTLQRLVEKKLAETGKISSYIEYGNKLSPQDLIARYLYGDYIHWDKEKREALEAAQADPVLERQHRTDFMESMLAFAHIYIGFAKLIDTMTGAAR